MSSVPPIDCGEAAFLDYLLQQPVPPPGSDAGVLMPFENGAGARAPVAASKPLLWRDQMLLLGERLLLGGAVLALGAYFASEPLPFWMHQLQAAEPAPAALHVADRLVQPTAVLSAYPGNTSLGQAPETEVGMLPQQLPEPLQAAPAPQPNRLEIPAIELDTVVVEMFVNDDWRWELPQYAAGYMHGTALPGEHSTMGISGHAGLFGGVFANLGALRPGDEVFVEAAGWRYRYRVSALRVVWPNQSEVLDPMGKPMLALITCTNWDLQRLVVFAEQLEARPL